MCKYSVDLSIIIPVYNCEKYLTRCLDSVLNQTQIRYECIIVDDGSLDDSLKICREYESKNNNFKVIHKNNEGVSAARNDGLNNAVGKYVTFLDADDYIVGDGYAAILKETIEKNADIACFGIYRELNGELFPVPFKHKNTVSDFIYYKTYMHAVYNKVYRKELIDKNDIRFVPGIKICEDMLFSFEVMAVASKVIFIPRCFYVYYYNLDSVSNSRIDEKKMQDYEITADAVSQFCAEHNLDRLYKKYIKYRYYEAALQYLITPEFYSPSKFRAIGPRFKVWNYGFKPWLTLITFFSSIKIDIFSIVYMRIRKGIKKR